MGGLSQLFGGSWLQAKNLIDSKLKNIEHYKAIAFWLLAAYWLAISYKALYMTLDTHRQASASAQSSKRTSSSGKKPSGTRQAPGIGFSG